MEQAKKSKSEYLAMIAEASGMEPQEVERLVAEAKEKYGIGYKSYYKYKCWKMSEKKLTAFGKETEYAELAAAERGMEISQIRRDMHDAKRKYAIGPAEYYNKRVWELTEEELEDIKAKKERRSAVIRIRRKDIYNVWDGRRFNFTLNKLSAITGIEIPEHFKAMADVRISELTISPLKIKKGLRVLFVTRFNENHDYAQYIKDGVVVISETQFTDETGHNLPQILLPIEQIRSAWQAIGIYVRHLFEVPTIGVTGSIGKTTLTSFMEFIFRERGKVFVSGGNLNSYGVFVREMLRRYSPDYDFHVQEVGGGRPGLAEASAKVLDVDAFCISNIGYNHLDEYKKRENTLYDKASFDRLGKEACFGVINIDDDLLRNYKYKSRIVTCGIEHTEADYVARNIRQNGEWLECDVVHHNQTLSVRVSIPGQHNAYNVLLAVAMAKEWDITDDEIRRGLLNYKSGFFRQSIHEISGRTLYIDCFNASTVSIESSLKALESMRKKGHKTIAVLGGATKLGNQNYSLNYELGLLIGNYDIDKFIFVGKKIDPDMKPEDYSFAENGYALYQGTNKTLRRKATFYENIVQVADYLVTETEPGDTILFKGDVQLNFLSAIDIAFGTSFSFYDYAEFNKRMVLEDEDYKVSYCVSLNGSSLRKCPADNGVVRIPDTAVLKPVFRISKGLFQNRHDITEIHFGRSVANIGNSAFKGCTGLKVLTLPPNVRHIEEEAFSDCSGLETVIMPGVEHIEKNAFKNCTNLRTVVLNKNCLTIEDGAFSGCKEISIDAPDGSYAKEYIKAISGNFAK